MALNQQTLQGNWNEIKGKLRERWGDLTGDSLESAHGNIEQLVGTIQRQTGEARESVEQYLEELTSNGASVVSKAAETVRGFAHAAQDTVQDTAKKTADAVRSGYAITEETVQNRPIGSVAVCFGAGLLAGVVVGLLIRSR